MFSKMGVVAEIVDFAQGFVGGPALLHHAVDGDGGAGAVGAVKALDEDGLVGGVFDDLEEFDHVFLFDVPGFAVEADVLQAGVFDLVGVAVEGAEGDDGFDAAFFEFGKTGFGVLGAAIEDGGDLGEIFDAGDIGGGEGGVGGIGGWGVENGDGGFFLAGEGEEGKENQNSENQTVDWGCDHGEIVTKDSKCVQRKSFLRRPPCWLLKWGWDYWGWGLEIMD